HSLIFFLPSTSPSQLTTLSLHDALPIYAPHVLDDDKIASREYIQNKIEQLDNFSNVSIRNERNDVMKQNYIDALKETFNSDSDQDRKSTRLNSSHVSISYAVFCLKKKKK